MTLSPVDSDDSYRIISKYIRGSRQLYKHFEKPAPFKRHISPNTFIRARKVSENTVVRLGEIYRLYTKNLGRSETIRSTGIQCGIFHTHSTRGVSLSCGNPPLGPKGQQKGTRTIHKRSSGLEWPQTKIQRSPEICQTGQPPLWRFWDNHLQGEFGMPRSEISANKQKLREFNCSRVIGCLLDEAISIHSLFLWIIHLQESTKYCNSKLMRVRQKGCLILFITINAVVMRKVSLES